MGKKIVYLVGDLSYPNGMSQVLSQKVNYLARHTDYDLNIILTEKASLPWFYEMDQRVKHVNFDLNFDDLYRVPMLKRLWVFAQRQRRYKKLFTEYLIRERPDIVVSVVRREIDFINDIADGSRKVGELHFNRSSYRQFRKRWLPDCINRAVTSRWQGKLVKELQRLDRFVVLTQEDYLCWAPDIKNLQVIPNAISCYPDKQSPCTAKQVIAVGRYTRAKGFDMLIKAWDIVHSQHPDWQLHIYGPGERETYQQQAEAFDLGGTLHCNGPVKNVYAKYLESSIFVLSSRHEGFGLVLAEAMATGVPCVAFDCPCGPRDIIRDGEDGLLVEPRNIEALAKGICYLIEHDNIRRQYGAAARKNAARFREDDIMKKWIALFESL